MIIKNTRYKNFFSSGNAFIEIDLQKHKQCVVGGKNGAGKSTVLNSITFGLFGKTIKNVTKSNMINSINGKNCLVEIDIASNGKDYTIRRGIKPNIFEILEDGVLIDQSSMLDYQSFLEETILKCSFRTFLQTSIISVESYKPFMGLAAKERRDFIEDILDIKIFSQMNILVKSNVTKNKEELKLLDVTLRGLKEKIVLQKAHIDKIEAMKQTGIDTLTSKLEELCSELDFDKKFITESDNNLVELKTRAPLLKTQKESRDSLIQMINELKANIKSVEKELVFFEMNDSCPTCQQGIVHSHVSAIVLNANVQHKEYSNNLLSVKTQLEEYVDLDDNISKYQSDLSEHNASVSLSNKNIVRLDKSIADINKEIEKIQASVDMQDQKDSLKVSATEAMKLRLRTTEINEEQDYNAIMLELFKDTGIKSKIVDQYIQVINLLVNQYLEKLDLFISFNLDSEFNETIKSRHRDDFTYDSFSMGQRQRIDMAMLFTFRTLAKMRNSFSCNLLCMDEIFESSLDSEGVQLLLGILDSEEFNTTNLLVVSHSNKELLEERFAGSYEVYMDGLLTQIRG